MPRDNNRELKRRGIHNIYDLKTVQEVTASSATSHMTKRLEAASHTTNDKLDHINNDSSLEDEESEEESSIESSIPTKSQIKGGKRLYPDLSPESFENEENELFQKPQNKSNSAFYIIICILLACALLHGYMHSYFYKRPAENNENKALSIINHLKQKFDPQPKLSLKIIKLALEKVINLPNGSEPHHPAILLLLSSKGAMDITTCFAKEMANMISQRDGGFENIRGSDLENKNANDVKKVIDNSISNALQHKGQHVVLIEDLDLIPAGAVMMLHSYCDHENAPFKNAVYIMTVNGNKVISPDTDSKKLDEVAMARLNDMWRELHADQLSALLSRITVSVAAVLPSSKFSYCIA